MAIDFSNVTKWRLNYSIGANNQTTNLVDDPICRSLAIRILSLSPPSSLCVLCLRKHAIFVFSFYFVPSVYSFSFHLSIVSVYLLPCFLLACERLQSIRSFWWHWWITLVRMPLLCIWVRKSMFAYKNYPVSKDIARSTRIVHTFVFFRLIFLSCNCE